MYPPPQDIPPGLPPGINMPPPGIYFPHPPYGLNQSTGHIDGTLWAAQQKPPSSWPAILISFMVFVTVIAVVALVIVNLNTRPGQTIAAVTAVPTTTQFFAAQVTTTAPTQLRGRTGDTLRQGGYIVTVNAVTKGEVFTLLTPTNGKTLVSVDLTIESDSARNVDVNPFYASIKDAAGFSYDDTFTGKEPFLKAINNLPVGEKIRGWLTFQVPADATSLIFSYAPLLGPTFRFNI